MVSPSILQHASAERRLQDLGIVLPNAPHPLGAYVETVQSGSLLFLSGMLPIKDGKPQYVGVWVQDSMKDTGRDALRTATLNALSVAKEHLGSLDCVSRVVRVGSSILLPLETSTTSPSSRTQRRSFSGMYLERARCRCGPSSE